MDRALKNFYRFLPRGWVQTVRNKLEYRGGTLDDILPRATSTPNMFDKRTEFRYPPSSQPRPVMPHGEPQKTYDIKYFSRDPRNVNRIPVSLEDNFRLPVHEDPEKLAAAAEEGALPEAPGLVTQPPGESRGSPGKRNPDVERYDPSRLRSAMTATWEEMEASLDVHQPNHLPEPEWARRLDQEMQRAREKRLAAMPCGFSRDSSKKRLRKYMFANREC